MAFVIPDNELKPIATYLSRFYFSDNLQNAVESLRKVCNDNPSSVSSTYTGDPSPTHTFQQSETNIIEPDEVAPGLKEPDECLTIFLAQAKS